MEDVALIEPFTNSDDILKKTSASTLRPLFLHTEDKSTSAAIFPPLEFMKVPSHLSPGVFFSLKSQHGVKENSPHQAKSNQSLFTLSAKRPVLDSGKCERLREGTSAGKMIQSPGFPADR